MACFSLAAAAMVAMVSVRRVADGGLKKKEKGKVMVGTKNQGKIDALTTTLKRWSYGVDAEVRGVKVQSGVRDQPYGIEETKDGAMNRAKRAFDSCENAILGVGLESGVLESKDGNLYDFCVCSIFDGKKHHVGISQFFALPGCVKKNFKSLGYNGAFDAAGVVPDDTGLGVLYYLSNGRMSRPSQTSLAIDGAMVSLTDRDSMYSKS